MEAQLRHRARGRAKEPRAVPVRLNPNLVAGAAPGTAALIEKGVIVQREPVERTTSPPAYTSIAFTSGRLPRTIRRAWSRTAFAPS